MKVVDRNGHDLPLSALRPVFRVQCPTCHAKPGWSCTTRGFGGDRVPHATREHIAAAATNCQAIIDDWARMKVNAPMQRLFAPGDKPCSRDAKESVGHLALCTTHARLAREGLVSETGRVCHRDDIRAVHEHPDRFPRGMHDWLPRPRVRKT